MADLPVTRAIAVPKPGDFAGAVEWMRRIRDRDDGEHGPEGLREHKKRRTRQQISDTATWMFCERGFDHVRVSDVAAAVGISEKTVFNYFPTKESLVFDREEEITERLVGAVRARDLGTSPIEAVMEVVADEQERMRDVPREAMWMLRAFDELITATPALVAAQRAMTNRIIAAIAQALAEDLELDPRDPEPQVVAHAIVALWETRETSMSRHLDEGLSGAEWTEAVQADAERAARLLETGLWAFNIYTQGRRTKRQIADAVRAMDDARSQIADAMRQAREAWRAAKGVRQDTRR
jgi:AcrR family transcriptional regulator